MSEKENRLKQYILWGALIILLSGTNVQAQPTQDDLKRIEDQLQQERETQLESKRQASKLANEIKAVQQQMVRSAKAVQEKEDMLYQLQSKMDEMQTEERQLSGRLALTDAQTVQLVTALQTLALRPPEVVLLEPQTPINALRSRLLLNKALPIVQNMSSSVLDDLSHLSETKANIQEQAKRVKDTMAQLGDKTTQMNTLIQQKAKLQAQYDASHQEAQRRIVSLANQAKDIKDLLDQLEIEKRRRQSEEYTPAPTRKPEKIASSLLPLGMNKTSFKKAKGYLPHPVRGRVIENYGDETSAGLHAKGITIEARGGSAVIAPYNGSVLFSGPFKNYGQLLIIDNGDGYLMLLAGMEQMNVTSGQEILAGEPVGKLKTGTPKLYVEIRKDGQPIDPAPWFAVR